MMEEGLTLTSPAFIISAFVALLAFLTCVSTYTNDNVGNKLGQFLLPRATCWQHEGKFYRLPPSNIEMRSTCHQHAGASLS
jgi:hypothetical protein